MKVSNVNQYKSQTTKRVVKSVIGAAAAVGTVLYLAKKGKLDPTENGNKHVETLKAVLKKPADKILNSKTFNKVAAKADKMAHSETATKIKDSAKTVWGDVTKGISTLMDKIESKFNKGKFN